MMMSFRIRGRVVVTNMIEIGGIDYLVLESYTPTAYIRRGLPNLARMMMIHGFRKDMYIRRPNGRVMFNVVQYRDGTYSKPVRFGR